MGMFSSSCSRCGSKEHSFEDCPHSMFSRECSKCGSTEHAFEDCPHSFLSKECRKCGSRDHTFEDCPHSFFSEECSKCGSTEHAFEDCPHSFFAKECSKCGSVNHATHECPQGFFARPPRKRERADDSDDDDLAGGLIKLGLIVGAVVFIFWLVFNVILPFIAINTAIIALIASFVFKDRKSIILPVSFLAGCFVVFDYNYGLFVSILQGSIEGSVSFIKYFVLINFVAGLVSAYFIGEKIIADRATDSADEEAYSRNKSILIGALALVGIGGIGAQYYFDAKNASSALESAAAGPSSPDLDGGDIGPTGPDPVGNSNTVESKSGETNASGLFGTWELVSRQCCGDMIGTDGLAWEQVSKAERERVTFDRGGRFASTSTSNPAGKWTLSDASIEGWYIYLVGVEIRGDTMIVLHTPTSSQNAYAEKWQRVTSSTAANSAKVGELEKAATKQSNANLVGRWEQHLAICGDPPDYALTISRNSFSSFAHTCRFTPANVFANAIKGKMSCEYFGEGPKPKGGFDMTIELTGERTLRFGDTGKELITYHKCG